MNFRQLEVLRTLLVTGSTTATARAMGLSQSGVSRLLQQLESDLSLQLFARDKGRLIPTPEAENWPMMPILSSPASIVSATSHRTCAAGRSVRNPCVSPCLTALPTI